jgi:DNA-binding CsgD family transcriptional regulator
MTSDAVIRSATRAAAAVLTARSAAQVSAAASPILAELGIHDMSVVERPATDADAPNAVLFTTVDETQTAKYRARGYASADPIVQRTLKGDMPRLLSGIGEENLSPLERKIFASYQCASGSKDGLVIPVRRSVHPDGVIVFGGVAPDLSSVAQSALTVLGHCIYGRIEELRALPAVQETVQTPLSPREAEVLGWIAKGKSDAEIAVILGLSERTARFHAANAKVKLDATTRVQAVTKALDLGLIAA